MHTIVALETKKYLFIDARSLNGDPSSFITTLSSFDHRTVLVQALSPRRHIKRRNAISDDRCVRSKTSAR
ncbi:hypothetical protein DPMN_175175 [Dreissena polymorpha]|uniref:Uncharacterized protein n=1 Tax=Dreissena polymorpha TaxID=45954 RepID=A0A9D4E8J0_DREPO|nr:hypothetical protein DPMN_175175 [Dreissena polymorpha]